MKGYVQVYTGDGKGKTTASLGLALRAVGAGLKVYVGQFLKSGDYSEIRALKMLGDQITVEQFGSGRFVKGQPTPEEIKVGLQGLSSLEKALVSGEYDLVIAEEGNVAVSCGLFPVESLVALIEARPESVELVVTGRGAHEKVIALADLVTEMREVKHYFEKGVAARVGIEK